MRRWGLGAFERNVLLLCAGAELEPDFLPACAQACGLAESRYPSFGLAFALFGDGIVHAQAMTLWAPLRRWGLIEIHLHSPPGRTSMRARGEVKVLGQGFGRDVTMGLLTLR
ncbi:hypothetical protein [Calidithermus roseus]|uniref:hypothetical protein n=1 Tax=Calidithermus roseus TaxID=1644118 RepID=UPI000E647FAD